MIHIYTYIYVYIYRMQEYQKVAMSWNKLYIPEKCIYVHICICVCKAMRSVCTPNPHPPPPRWPPRPPTTVLKQHPPHLTPPLPFCGTMDVAHNSCSMSMLSSSTSNFAKLCTRTAWICAKVAAATCPLWLMRTISIGTISLCDESLRLGRQWLVPVRTLEGSLRSLCDSHHTRVERIDVLTYWAGCLAYRVSCIIPPSSFHVELFLVGRRKRGWYMIRPQIFVVPETSAGTTQKSVIESCGQRSTCGQHSSRVAGSRRRALAYYFSVRIWYVFLISICTGKSCMTSVLAKRMRLHSADFRGILRPNTFLKRKTALRSRILFEEQT